MKIGVVWQTRSITEADATVSIYTMIFAAVLSAVKLFQGPADAPNTSSESRRLQLDRQEITAISETGW
jgi:hypothetical protein